MAFKMRSPFKDDGKKGEKKYTDEQVSNALEDWKEAQMNSEDYRINQLNDEGGSKSRFNELDSITKSKYNIFENMLKNSDFKPNKTRERTEMQSGNYDEVD